MTHYETHSLKNNHGIKFIHETAINIDPEKNIIITDKQNITYDKLILSPGVQLDYSSIENWNENYIEDFPAAWKAGKETILLSNKIKRGGVLISDNVLWSGKVIEPLENSDLSTKVLIEYNKLLKEDPRFETILLPIRDGLTLSIKR